jgi:hypothetical protein
MNNMNEFANYMRHSHWNWHPGHWLVLIILVVLLILAFEVWMLVDDITNKKVPTKHKVWWAIGMFLVHPFVAIIYFFVSRLHYNKT